VEEDENEELKKGKFWEKMKIRVLGKKKGERGRII
jgi:hypothetical protein